MSIRSILKKAYQLVFFFKRRKFGYLDPSVDLPYPLIVNGFQNVYIEKDSFLSGDSILYANHAKIIIKRNFLGARGLRIITGEHERRVGFFCSQITESIKDNSLGLDQEVIIEEDVWCGMNVTILKGVVIGRGSNVAAGAVVTKSTPPYSISGGVPCKFIKFYWTIDQILKHEAALYKEEDRYTRQQLIDIFSKYNK